MPDATKPKAPARNRRQFLVGVDVPAGVTAEEMEKLIAEALTCWREATIRDIKHPLWNIDADSVRVRLVPAARK